LYSSLEELRPELADAHRRMRNHGVALDPHQAASQRRLLLIERLSKKDRRFRDIDPVSELRIDVKTDVVRLR